MLKAHLKIKFVRDITVEFGVEYLKKILSFGSAKNISIRSKARERLCEYHKDVECDIVNEYEDNVVDIIIIFPYCLSGATSGIAELINSLLYCSVFSLIENYIVEDFYLDSKVDLFSGPRFGVTGIRNMVKVYQTPLMGIILKPRTRIDLNAQKYVVQELCESGLINYLIDDELVISPNCCMFEEKISSYVEMLDYIERRSGKRILYWVNATADIEFSKKIIDFSLNKGINTFCLNPVTMGFSAVKFLVDSYEKKAIFLANNIGRGVLSRPPQYYITEKVLAKLSRLAGADAVYTGPISSSFPYDIKVLRDEREALQSDFCGFKDSFAVTSGDIGNGKSVGENVNAVGRDVMIQMGGGLLEENSSEKLKVFSFIANYALDDVVLREVNEVYITVEQEKIRKGNNLMSDKHLIRQRNEQLTEYINKQLLLRNEYKQAMSATRDPQELFKYKTELNKCENTILEFAYELNDLAESNPDIIDLDGSSYKAILQISEQKLLEMDEKNLADLIGNLDNLFENVQEIADVDNSIQEKIDEYNLQTSVHNKLELSLPIIPLFLNYKVDLSLDCTKKLRKVLVKIFQLAKRKKP